MTDDGACAESNEIMRRAVEYAKMFDLPIMDHCQDTSLTEGAVMNEANGRLAWPQGWPKAAEDIIVARNVILQNSQALTFTCNTSAQLIRLIYYVAPLIASLLSAVKPAHTTSNSPM